MYEGVQCVVPRKQHLIHLLLLLTTLLPTSFPPYLPTYLRLLWRSRAGTSANPEHDALGSNRHHSPARHSAGQRCCSYVAGRG
ncbi:hypothetical protein T484DRAFT_1940046 [Baffinella frigidus]|nr:hypothetical protein T484DRAFT_1940046 [Cryptophyta sp. CCMP2293]